MKYFFIKLESIGVFWSCIAEYYHLSSLKQCMLLTHNFLSQKFMHRVTGLSIQGLRRLKSKGWQDLSTYGIWGLFQAHPDCDKIWFLWLQAWGPCSLTGCHLGKLSTPRSLLSLYNVASSKVNNGKIFLTWDPFPSSNLWLPPSLIFSLSFKGLMRSG